MEKNILEKYKHKFFNNNLWPTLHFVPCTRRSCRAMALWWLGDISNFILCLFIIRNYSRFLYLSCSQLELEHNNVVTSSLCIQLRVVEVDFVMYDFFEGQLEYNWEMMMENVSRFLPCIRCLFVVNTCELTRLRLFRYFNCIASSCWLSKRSHVDRRQQSSRNSVAFSQSSREILFQIWIWLFE